jgi:hypothetical protein
MSRSKELGFTTFFITRFPEPMPNFLGAPPTKCIYLFMAAAAEVAPDGRPGRAANPTDVDRIAAASFPPSQPLSLSLSAFFSKFIFYSYSSS